MVKGANSDNLRKDVCQIVYLDSSQHSNYTQNVFKVFFLLYCLDSNQKSEGHQGLLPMATAKLIHNIHKAQADLSLINFVNYQLFQMCFMQHFYYITHSSESSNKDLKVANTYCLVSGNDSSQASIYIPVQLNNV